MKAAGIYERFCNGDPLSDEDLTEGIAHFRKLSDLAFQAGPVFRLAGAEANRVCYALESFRDARKRK